MNKALKFTFAAVLATSAMTGYSYAQAAAGEGTNALDAEQSGQTTGQTDTTTTNSTTPMADSKFTVVFIKDLEDTDASKPMIEEKIANAETVAAAQAEVASNADLRMQLESQKVQLNNVVYIERGVNDTQTIYVK